MSSACLLILSLGLSIFQSNPALNHPLSKLADQAVLVQATQQQEVILAVIERNYDTGFTGFSEVESFPVQGRITRADIEVSKSGTISGGANITHVGDGRVDVHRYLDLFSHLHFKVTVYGYRA